MTNKVRESNLDLSGLPTSLPPGGLTGQVLVKLSNANYDVAWANTNIDSLRVNVASAVTVDLTAVAAVTRNILLTGVVAITGFQVAGGENYFVKVNGACTLVNSANLVTNTGADIVCTPNSTFILRATADNVVEVLCYTPA